MWKYHALAIAVKPSAPADMQDYLAVTDGEIIDTMRFRKAIGTEIMPFLVTKVTLIKMNMYDATFQACFLYDACMFFIDVADFKHFKDVFGEYDFQQCLVC